MSAHWPRLVTVAHGTRSAVGTRVTHGLVRQVARRLGGVEVVGSHVELAEPLFAEVMARSTGPSVVVPLLLSSGYHVSHDLPEAARHSPAPVTITRPLGPHPLLATAGAMQLRAAGARAADAVLLVVAGSRDPGPEVDAAVAARLLRGHRGGSPVYVGHLAGAGPGVPEVVERMRLDGHRRIVASPYLLAPGHFLTMAGAVTAAQGVPLVADVLGRHPLVAELVARRYLAAIRAAPTGERPRVA